MLIEPYLLTDLTL